VRLAASCLQLDVGNSGSKWRLLQDGQVVARGIYRPVFTRSNAAVHAELAANLGGQCGRE